MQFLDYNLLEVKEFIDVPQPSLESFVPKSDPEDLSSSSGLHEPNNEVLECHFLASFFVVFFDDQIFLNLNTRGYLGVVQGLGKAL